MKHLLSLKNLTVLTLAAMAITSAGCAKGEKGDAGQDGGGRIVSTINCTGTVQNSGRTELEGLEVDYDAVLTSGGDVYSTGVIIDETYQYSGTSFYAAGQVGADTAQVLVTADYVGTRNGGYWAISLDRRTLIATAIYKDTDYTKTLTFLPSACKIKNW